MVVMMTILSLSVCLFIEALLSEYRPAQPTCTVVSVTSSRTYRSELREQQAERTRLLIARSARERFLEKGWSGTSVRSVAAGAGVSEATVYHVYGSKAGLAASLIDAAEESADVALVIAEMASSVGDPAAQLRAFVAFDRRLFEHGGDVLRVLAEARRQEPDLAAAYEEGRGRGETQRRRLFESWPARSWAKGVDVQAALDAYAMVVSLEAYDIAVRERGWDADDVEAWWHRVLATLLLR
jgi:AcrR family transcriptional regulator